MAATDVVDWRRPMALTHFSWRASSLTAGSGFAGEKLAGKEIDDQRSKKVVGKRTSSFFR